MKVRAITHYANICSLTLTKAMLVATENTRTRV